jgi:uncharacterized OB-fold protein
MDAAVGQALLPGWYTLDQAAPQLIGTRCAVCGTYYFPPLPVAWCRNPDCASPRLEQVRLSRTGKLWSYTDAAYPPPPPFVAPDPYRPFAIAAVELEKEKMIVLGPVVEGVGVDALRVGMAMELKLEPLADGKLVWKWKPAP